MIVVWEFLTSRAGAYLIAVLAIAGGLWAGAMYFEHKGYVEAGVDWSAKVAAVRAENESLTQALRAQSAAVQALVTDGQKRQADADRRLAAARADAQRHEERARALEAFQPTGDECRDLRALVEQAWTR